MRNKQTNEKRQFLGVWIPRDIYLDKRLNWTDKILLIEIESLDNERGCFASNDYFAEFLGVSKTTISISVSKLKELGLIEQISFDGRTRILKAEFKQTERQSLSKLKCSVKANVKHNNTESNTDNNPIIKEKSKNKKDFEISETQKNNATSNATFINVSDLKTEITWLEHCARYLALNLKFTNELLEQFISEQKLKDDDFKSIKDTKSHFLNWAKIEVSKRRKYGNDSWGRSKLLETAKNGVKTNSEPLPTISESEKKELHKNFITQNLFVPYQNFVKFGNLRIENFGGLIFKELNKHDLIIDDLKLISEIKSEIENLKSQKKGGRISQAFAQQMGKQSEMDFELEMVKASLAELKLKGVDLKDKIKFD